MNKLLLASLLPAAMIALGTSHAATVTLTEVTTPGNIFGTTGGVAIDFDTTDTAATNWTPALTVQPYNINSITLYLGAAQGQTLTNAAVPNTATVRIGVYSTLTGTTATNGTGADLGGFQGFSTNTIDLSLLAANAPLTFNFADGIVVTPQTNAGSGTDIRYFVFQTGNTPILTLFQSTAVAIRRIDDGTTTSFDDELAVILQNNSGGTSGGADTRLNSARTPEYSATITPIPEPTALSLLGVAGAALVSRRRRQN